jgi:hypothetical protein
VGAVREREQLQVESPAGEARLREELPRQVGLEELEAALGVGEVADHAAAQRPETLAAEAAEQGLPDQQAAAHAVARADHDLVPRHEQAHGLGDELGGGGRIGVAVADPPCPRSEDSAADGGALALPRAADHPDRQDVAGLIDHFGRPVGAAVVDHDDAAAPRLGAQCVDGVPQGRAEAALLVEGRYHHLEIDGRPADAGDQGRVAGRLGSGRVQCAHHVESPCCAFPSVDCRHWRSARSTVKKPGSFCGFPHSFSAC